MFLAIDSAELPHVAEDLSNFVSFIWNALKVITKNDPSSVVNGCIIVVSGLLKVALAHYIKDVWQDGLYTIFSGLLFIVAIAFCLPLPRNIVIVERHHKTMERFSIFLEVLTFITQISLYLYNQKLSLNAMSNLETVVHIFSIMPAGFMYIATPRWA